MSRYSRFAPWIVLAMLAMVALPAAITLNTVNSPATLQIPSNPTPHGYTWSLLLFIVPIVIIALWFWLNKQLTIPKRAFWRTIWILFPLGAGLDFFFAHSFFTFPNADATVKIGLPALGGSVPIEEYFFYFTGFIAVLLIYIWLDEYWLALYNVPDYRAEGRSIPRFLQFHPASAAVGLLLIAFAFIYKKNFSQNPEGFPGYFTFLALAALLPASALFPTAKRFINWRAFSLTMFFILLVSLLWEATLAIPYGWWGYQKTQMLGIFINGWSGLPIEAVCVWIAVSYATTTIFEIVKLWQASERPLRHALIGGPSPARGRAAGAQP